MAVALKADVCEIYTDVEGVYTADPRVVPDARKLERICHDEMLEMASAGSRVMATRSIEFAKKYNVTLHIRSSFSDKEGTYVVGEVEDMEEVVISGLSCDKDQAKITVVGVPDKPGVAARIFESVAEAGIIVDMIVQNVGENARNDISFTVPAGDLKQALTLVEEVAGQIDAERAVADPEIAKVSAVGVGMRSHSGVAAKMFSTLAQENINIEMISTSEIKIACVIRKEQADVGVRALHKTFELDKESG
jgi:aspartate kinase